MDYQFRSGALEGFPDRPGLYRIVLEPTPEGVYVFVWKTRESLAPEMDYLQDHFTAAFSFCSEDLDVGNIDWKELTSE